MGADLRCADGLRHALIAVVGVMPLMVIKIFHLLIVFDLQMQNKFAYYYSGDYTPPTRAEIILPTLLTLGLITGAWGMTLLGAAMGVRSALVRHRTETAVTAAPFALLATLVGQCVCVGAVSMLFPGDGLCGVIVFSLLVIAVVLIVPYALVINTVWTTADRWWR
jgi:hypothetical protein